MLWVVFFFKLRAEKVIVFGPGEVEIVFGPGELLTVSATHHARYVFCACRTMAWMLQIYDNTNVSLVLLEIKQRKK